MLGGGPVGDFDFVRELLLKHQKSDCPETRQEQMKFVMKFQQNTSPVMAKGVEDTAFYIYNRLIGDVNTKGARVLAGISESSSSKWELSTVSAR